MIASKGSSGHRQGRGWRDPKLEREQVGGLKWKAIVRVKFGEKFNQDKGDEK